MPTRRLEKRIRMAALGRNVPVLSSLEMGQSGQISTHCYGLQSRQIEYAGATQGSSILLRDADESGALGRRFPDLGAGTF